LIQLYSWSTSNGRKIHIMLEETGIPYELHPVNIMAGEQFDPEFLTLSPNNKIPVIVDTDGPGDDPLVLFESGAILLYLAEKSGMLLSSDPRERITTLQWLFFQVGGIGPLFGQRNHFSLAAKVKHQYAINRYENESQRLCKVVDGALAQKEFIAGAFSIADIAIFTWMKAYASSGGSLDEFSNVENWLDVVEARPAVQRGMNVLAERSRSIDHSDKVRDILFGDSQINQKLSNTNGNNS
jgi:GST-like protein